MNLLVGQQWRHKGNNLWTQCGKERVGWMERAAWKHIPSPGICPTQGSNPGLPRCRQILYQLSHKGSPRILEWVAYPFSSRSSDPGIEPGSPALQADSLPTELWGKPQHICCCLSNREPMVIFSMTPGTQMRLCNNLEGREGVGGEREVQERGDRCMPVADSCWCIAKNNTIL